MKKYLTLGLLAASTLALTGCYSISFTKVDSLFGSNDKPGQTLNVSTVPNGANCTVSSNSGTTVTTQALVTPGEVGIYKGSQNVKINCNRSGYQATEKSLNPNSDGSFPSSVTITLQK